MLGAEDRDEDDEDIVLPLRILRSCGRDHFQLKERKIFF